MKFTYINEDITKQKPKPKIKHGKKPSGIKEANEKCYDNWEKGKALYKELYFLKLNKLNDKELLEEIAENLSQLELFISHARETPPFKYNEDILKHMVVKPGWITVTVRNNIMLNERAKMLKAEMEKRKWIETR